MALLRCVATALKHKKNIFKTIFNQGEATEDWAYDEPVEMEVKAPATNSLNSEFYTPGGEQLWGPRGKKAPWI